MKESILIVDDDLQVCELLVDILSEHNYTTILAHSGEQALHKIKDSQEIALILLDLILPDINGLTLLQQLKSLTEAPIIMLSGLGSDLDAIVGLEMGADDYIGKPFYPRMVVARVKAALRRLQSVPSLAFTQGFAFRQWFLNTQNNRLYNPLKQEVELTHGEYVLLRALLQNAQKVLSRQQLLALTHSDTLEIFDRTIDVLIMRLRKKIETNPKAPSFIQTVRGEGYLFACAVEVVG